MLVTSASIGYGDIYPMTRSARTVIIAVIVIMIIVFG
jgi:hypothetical protein